LATFKSTVVFKEALRVTADFHPDSVVADLLGHIPPRYVAKIVRIYSGQKLCIPSTDDIWRNYRDKVIRETLDTEDNKDVRRRLARFFSVSLSHVSAIYHREKRKHPRNSSAVAKRAYKKGLKSACREMTELFLRKS